MLSVGTQSLGEIRMINRRSKKFHIRLRRSKDTLILSTTLSLPHPLFTCFNTRVRKAILPTRRKRMKIRMSRFPETRSKCYVSGNLLPKRSLINMFPKMKKM
jgi:hypothetical protein